VTGLEARSVAVTPPGAGQAVIRDMSLKIRPGEWLAVTGANGSGKSSLAMALAGLWPASAGEISWNGEPLAYGEGARRDIAVVFQDPSSQLLQPTVREELSFTARNLDLPGSRIERSVARISLELGIAAELGRDPRTLSAGRQQLVLLGAALVSGPALLVADEPGAHLDSAAREAALGAVRTRVAEGLAVLWVTQDDRERGAADRELHVGTPRTVETARIPAPGAGISSEILLEATIGAPPDHGPAVRIEGLAAIRIATRGLHAVTGSNGSGKTVLLNAIAGLSPMEQVRVRWIGTREGSPIMATQYPELQIFEERVGDELSHAARRRGIADHEVQATISQWLTGMTDNPSAFLDRRCWSLSAGEKRWVGLLGALAAPASIVLLDEPTAGLDMVLRSRVGEIVRERASRDPVLVATQDLDWVRELGGIFVGGAQPAPTSPSHSQKTD
jgi:energy-coupling factor transporter ATP-binding protein EcfA2